MSLRASQAEPERVALLGKDLCWTYRELAARGRDAVADLDGLAGRRAFVIARSDALTVTTIVGLLDAGVSFALVPESFSPAEREAAIARVDPAWVIDGARRDRRGGAAPGDEQAIVFSSGTTGAPKGVRLDRAALEAAAEAHARALPFGPDDRWLLTLSPARVGGLGVVLRCLHAGAAVVLPDPPRFAPDAWMAQVRTARVTWLSLVPTMLARLLQTGPPPPSLRAVLLGGAPCPPPLLARGRALGWPLLPTYGMSETCAQVCTQRLDDPRPEGVGAPLPGVTIALDDDGAIAVSGPTVMRGYLGEAPRTGPYLTGDLGRWLPGGQLEILGRADDRILTGGETVDPAEVEAALRACPGVDDAAVVGLPDPEYGQVVTAVVVGVRIDLDSLRAALAPRLARYKHPRRLEWADALPRNALGKLDRRAIAARLTRSPPRSTRVS